MKKIVFSALFLISALGLKAQEVSVGMEFYNRYVFRGVDFGNAPSLQPSLEFSTGGFTLGAWGAYSTGFGGDGAFAEADLYTSYAFDFGLSLGLTSYYYPGTSWFETAEGSSTHALEFNLGYEIGSFAFGGNYMINDSRDGAGAEGQDLYFEVGYSASLFDVFVGAGDGWHTTEGSFQVVNIGIAATKELTLTEQFSLPLSGAVILNPNTEQLHLVFGLSF